MNAGKDDSRRHRPGGMNDEGAEPRLRPFVMQPRLGRHAFVTRPVHCTAANRIAVTVSPVSAGHNVTALSSSVERDPDGAGEARLPGNAAGAGSPGQRRWRWLPRGRSRLASVPQHAARGPRIVGGTRGVGLRLGEMLIGPGHSAGAASRQLFSRYLGTAQNPLTIACAGPHSRQAGQAWRWLIAAMSCGARPVFRCGRGAVGDGRLRPASAASGRFCWRELVRWSLAPRCSCWSRQSPLSAWWDCGAWVSIVITHGYG